MTESYVYRLYNNGRYWVQRGEAGYEVYEHGVATATPRVVISSVMGDALALATAAADRLKRVEDDIRRAKPRDPANEAYIYFGGHVADQPHPCMSATGTEGRCMLCGQDEEGDMHKPPYVRAVR